MVDQVRVVAVLQALEGMGAELLTLWPWLAAEVRAEQGCLGYDLHRVAGDPDRFVVLERWESLPALSAHGVSPHMQEFGGRSAALLAAPAQVIVLEDERAV